MMPMGGRGGRSIGGGMTIAEAKWLMEHPAEAEALDNAHKRRMDAYAKASADHKQRKAEADQRHADADARDRELDARDQQQPERDVKLDQRAGELLEEQRELD